MIDFRAIAKLAGLNDIIIEDLVRQLKLENTDVAYERGVKETLSKVNTLIEITLLNVKDNLALKEVAETIKRWMKTGFDPITNEKPPHNFVQLTEGKWYHPDKNIIVNSGVDCCVIYFPHQAALSVKKEELDSVLMKLS